MKSRTSSDEDEDYYPNLKEKSEGERTKRTRRKIYGNQRKRVKLESFKKIRQRLDSISSSMSRELNKDNYPFVKNFCVSTVRLKDEFVKNALNGHVIWHQVNEQEVTRIKKERESIRMTSRAETRYLFDSDASNSNSDFNYESSTSGYESSTESLSRFRPQFTQCLKLVAEHRDIDDLLEKESQNLDSSKEITIFNKDLDVRTLNKLLQYLNHEDRFKHSGNLISDRPIRCVNCSFSSTSIDGIIVHSLVHQGVCGLCQTSFKTFYAYFRHIAIHFQQSQRECLYDLDYRCTHCTQTFNQETKLIQHFNDTHALLEENLVYGLKTIKFKCEICNLIDNTLSSLLDHYLQAHSQIKCSICNQWYANLDQLEQHAFNHHKLFTDNYECEFCLLKFTFKTSYKDHLKYKHAICMEEFRRRCLLCDRLFRYDEDMDSIVGHLAEHCGLFLYECDTCEFRTNSKSTMVSHVANVNLDNENQILLGNHVDINRLWIEISRQIKLLHCDYVIGKNQLDEAIDSILY